MAALAAILGAAFKIFGVLSDWFVRWVGLEGQVQDHDRAGIKTRQDKHEATTEGWYKELHARISRQQEQWQASDKELLGGLHRLEVEMMEKFATKADVLATEARIIDAFNRNMDRREEARGRGGQQ